MLALAIRSAPRQARQHVRHRGLLWRDAVESEFTCYAAHGLFSVLIVLRWQQDRLIKPEFIACSKRVQKIGNGLNQQIPGLVAVIHQKSEIAEVAGE